MRGKRDQLGKIVDIANATIAEWVGNGPVPTPDGKSQMFDENHIASPFFIVGEKGLGWKIKAARRPVYLLGR